MNKSSILHYKLNGGISLHSPARAEINLFYQIQVALGPTQPSNQQVMGAICWEVQQLVVMVPTYLRLVPRLRIRGVIPQLAIKPCDEVLN